MPDGGNLPVPAASDAEVPATRGHLPNGLDWLYLRNGPNPRFSPIGCNRFVRTPAVKGA
jgi:carotenoid cleavage dioxygenase-like enzyme